MAIDAETVDIRKSDDVQVIIGHAGFIKTVEDLYEAMVNSVPGIEFGLAFIEASGPCLVRVEGNDPELEEQASKSAMAVGAGHTFIILFRNAYPINVMDKVKAVPEVARIYCATANNVQVLVTSTRQGKSVIGVVDGAAAKGIEDAEDKKIRKEFLKKIGYKLR
jgi:hypothetical protein